MKIYTKTGDRGETGLHGGARISKSDLRVCAYGDCDELNAALGWCRSACTDRVRHAAIEAILSQLQVLIFEASADLATPPDAGRSAKGKVRPVTDDDIARLESWIDDCTAQLEEQKTFFLPGGCELAARLHLARTVCRRAERSVVHLLESESSTGHASDHDPDTSLILINRLSDLLFVLARLANSLEGFPDIPWIPRGRRENS